jgi:CubicO group peptidase (beta-lactamase class C family)
LDRVTVALDRHLDALVRRGVPPALAVVVVKGGTTVYARAFGIADGPTRRPARLDDVYHFWSVTKLFTATAIMQLVEDCRVTLDDPLSKFLPDFPTVSPAGRPASVTLRQLLDHSSGIGDFGPRQLVGWIHAPGDPPVGQTEFAKTRMAALRRLRAEPGAAGRYSNAGYVLLGAVVEAVTGTTYEDHVRRRILAPLGMTASDFIYRDDMLPRAVSGSHRLFHVFTPLLLAIHPDWFSRRVARTVGGRMWLRPLYTDYTPPTGLIGSAEDLAKFGQAFLPRDGASPVPILRRETILAMRDQFYGGNFGPDGDRMGLGWHWFDREPVPFKGHGGDGPGFRAQLAILPERDMVVVVLANDMLADRLALTRAVITAFI